MKTKIAIVLTAWLCAACATHIADKPASKAEPAKSSAGRVEAAPERVAGATTLAAYQKVLAEHISDVNAAKVAPGRPQALLRSVIVLKYTVDAHGNLLHSEIVRTNHDGVTQAAALSSLKNAVPFPRPAAHLLRNGRVEITETWLFNSDARFQLRTIAKPQLSE